MVSLDKERKKMIAEESPKTQRQLDAFDKKITPQALEKKTIEIHRWIARHAPNRVALKTKSISLFDENRNAADLSQRVGLLAEQMKHDFHLVSEDEKDEKMSKLKKLVSRLTVSQVMKVR
jgi:hypothetical protein